MNIFDALTLFDSYPAIGILLCINVLTGAFFFAFETSARPAQDKEIIHKAAMARAAFSAACLLLILRGALPRAISVNIGSSLLFLCFYMDARLLLSFSPDAGKWRQRTLIIILAAGVVICNALDIFLTGAAVNPAAAASVIPALYAVPALSLITDKSGGPFKRRTGAFYILLIILFLPRIIISCIGVDASSYINAVPEAMQGLALVGVSVCGALAVLLFIKEKDELLIESAAASGQLAHIPSRHSFMEKANALFLKCRQEQHGISLMYTDIDCFKEINDEYGHDFGDGVVKRYGLVIKETIRTYDLFCRYGGEEFLIMLSSDDTAAAESIAQRIMERLEQEHFTEYPDFRFTVSVGIAVGIPGDEDTLDTFIKNAKAALHEAKNDGNGTIRLFQLSTLLFIKEKGDRELEAALEAAKSANKEKSTFLANMSHEIRTPMNAISGISEMLLQDESLPPKVSEGISMIYNSSDLLLGIINDILDLSKIEAGKMELIEAEYDAAKLISDAVQLNLVRFDDKPVEFTLAVDENIPSVMIGDALRVKQILNNILSNAAKYTQKGEVVLEVSARAGAREDSGNGGGVTLVCTVRDTGVGMSEEEVSKLFDEYTRFNERTDRLTQGTGLGMHITRNLLLLMNGEIHVESQLGKGSVFTVYIPQEKVGGGVLGRGTAEQLQRFRTDSSLKIKSKSISREPMPYGSVLIVDDTESNIYVAEGLLSPYDLKIDTAMNGYEAVDIIKNGKLYDIIFMDHMMPKMDGIETVKIIRGLGYRGTIVAMTANAMTGQSEIFLANGFDGFISKPIDTQRLDALLNKFIRDTYPPEVVEKARRQKAGPEEGGNAETAGGVQADVMLMKSVARDAERAIAGIESLMEKRDASEDSVRMYRISVHSMKSALANIGETALSQKAADLEQAAVSGDMAVLLSDTPAFLDDLRSVIEKINRSEEEAGEDITEDKVELLKKLDIIQRACERYDVGYVYEAATELREKKWTARTKKQLDIIGNHLLHGDYEEIKNAASAYISLLANAETPIVSILLNREIDDLDIGRGLAKFDANVKTYIKILRSFAAGLRATLAAIETVTEETLRDYEISVHGVKGTSLDIFANQLGEYAKNLEMAAKANDLDYINANNPAFLEKAWKLVGELEELLSAAVTEEPKPKKSKPDAEMLARLADACMVYSMDRVDAAMAEISKYQYDTDNELVAWLQENVDMTNYGDIVKRLSAQ